LNSFEKFKAINKDMLDWVVKDKEELKSKVYMCNENEQLIKNFTYTDPKNLLNFTIKEK